MLELLLLLILVPFFFLIILFMLFKKRRKGVLPITTEDVAYNRKLYKPILDWDMHGFIIRGQKVQLFSGEFHYWRLPDRSRWESILQKYKASGLNCIRIYFHWGFHSPDQGVYHFDGNRDIVYLMELCKKLQLFVLCAPGPYICAETSAGGYPFWLLAKKGIKIRHTKGTMGFGTHLLGVGMITESETGCVIGLQIENEYFENFVGLPLGLDDTMKFLCHHARKLGMTVPLFTNDGFEVGSYISKQNSSSFGIDLYGFDKYVIFVPISHPVFSVFGVEKDCHIRNYEAWKPSNFIRSIDNIEKTVRNFGGAAAETPIFVPELQGGWFNHYKLEHTYDDVYNYYGEAYTRAIFESIVAQGSNSFNFYMFYGGTNWATIGDPDVYTSYDYSACIREYGFLSGRGRRLRLAISFSRSFSAVYRETEEIKPTVLVYPKSMLNKQRQMISNSIYLKPNFVFIRNFSDQINYTLQVAAGNITLKGRIPYKHSFVSIGNYKTNCKIDLIATTCPIHYKTIIGDDEIWVVQCDEEVSGQFAFRGSILVRGALQHTVKEFYDTSILTIQNPFGCLSISNNFGVLYIIALTGNDLFTFNPIWRDKWFSDDRKADILCIWGITDSSYDHITNQLSIGISSSDVSIFTLARKCPKTFSALTFNHYLSDCPYIWTRSTLEESRANIDVPALMNWETRTTDFDAFTWKFIPIKVGPTHKLKPVMNLSTLGYNSGHVFYRVKFSMKGNVAHIDLNIRHRVTLYLNDYSVGGHMTYSLQMFRPGSKVGPDPGFLGFKRYVLPSHLLKSENKLIIQIENFGFGRQAFVLNDIKNARGLLDSRLIPGSNSSITNIQLEVAGVETRLLGNVFLTSGFPDENTDTGFVPVSRISPHLVTTITPEKHILSVPVDTIPVWYRSTFDDPNTSFDRPLRLHLMGLCTAFIWVNDTLIGKYYGNGDGPQKDFYIMEGLLISKQNVLKLVCYDGRIEIEHHPELIITLTNWKLSTTPSKYWSGNLCEDGDSYILHKQNISL